MPEKILYIEFALISIVLTNISNSQNEIRFIKPMKEIELKESSLEGIGKSIRFGSEFVSTIA